MAKTKMGTVVNTGANSGALLEGMEPRNMALRLKVHQDQDPEKGGRIIGSFDLLEAGNGTYAQYFKPLVGQSFCNAAELIDLVASDPNANKCRHVLNCNGLKLVTEA